RSHAKGRCEAATATGRALLRAVRTAVRQRPGVEAEVARPVAPPVRARVAAGPAVDAYAQSACAQRRHKVAVSPVEGIGRAGVEPEWLAGPHARPRAGRAHDVVAREVGGAVEGAGRGLARARPDRRRVPAHRTEAARIQPRKVEGAEASHRDAADGNAVWIGAGPPDRLRDHLVDHVAAPGRATAIVP